MSVLAEALDLRGPIFAPAGGHGHFGCDDLDRPRKRLDRVDGLRPAAR